MNYKQNTVAMLLVYALVTHKTLVLSVVVLALIALLWWADRQEILIRETKSHGYSFRNSVFSTVVFLLTLGLVAETAPVRALFAASGCGSSCGGP
jgi:hypothetical protein